MFRIILNKRQMSISVKSIKTGVFSFLIVLFLMPIGHALMVLNEKLSSLIKKYGVVMDKFSSPDIALTKNKFIVGYGGNLSHNNSIMNLIDSAIILKDKISVI